MFAKILGLMGPVMSLLGFRQTDWGGFLLALLIIIALMVASYYWAMRIIYTKTVREELDKEYETEMKVVEVGRRKARLAWLGPPIILVLGFSLLKLFK